MARLFDYVFRAATSGIAMLVAGMTGDLGTPEFPDARSVATDIVLANGASDDTGIPTALVMGGSGLPTPSRAYADTAAALYLNPHGFTGTPQVLTTPHLTSDYGLSERVGADILVEAIEERIDQGDVHADNRIYVFGYSQSSALSTYAMRQLHENGTSPSDLHFIMVGNTANPNGGLLSAFDLFGTHPFIPGVNVTLDQATPSDLYSADVYTLEYDGWADFPRYPMNFISVLNAVAGMVVNHMRYLGLTEDQIANAVQLPTTPGSLVDYFMVRSDILPLLAPLRLLPFVGKPMYDLLEPATRILVNLGYGSIDNGWNDGPADVATPIRFGMPELNWNDVIAALDVGWEQGLAAYNADLPGMFTPEPFMSNPVIAAMVDALFGGGGITDPDPVSWAVLFGSIVISEPWQPVETLGDLIEFFD